MGFGGVGSMNVVLKNNRNLLPKRDKFKRPIGVLVNSKVEYDLPKATPKLLRDIKKKIIEERQSRQKRIVILWSILMVLFTIALIYLK